VHMRRHFARKTTANPMVTRVRATNVTVLGT
jgi:hypothetical protein